MCAKQHDLVSIAQDALGFVTAPSIVNHDNIIDLTTNVKFHMTCGSSLDKNHVQDKIKQAKMTTRFGGNK